MDHLRFRFALRQLVPAVEVVREDPGNPQLLYAGTHFGLFASFDQGAHWIKIGGLPSVRVDDLQIQPRTSDLVIATHGRSIAVLDDVFDEVRIERKCCQADQAKAHLGQAAENVKDAFRG